jgi:argininosuccinate lyase
MSKIWQATENHIDLHPLIESFTIDEDRELDLQLLPFDIEGTRAHAQSLLAAGIIDDEEKESIEATLSELLDEFNGSAAQIPEGMEDCHSLIEARLVEKLGPVGEKIHAGRSRNDQVLTALRLLQKSRFRSLERRLDRLVASLDAAIQRYQQFEMPGYSHGRRGMVITVGDWLGSYYELFAEDQIKVIDAIVELDRSPLGAGAGFGNGLGLDRRISARALGFSRVQKNSLACMGSRGKDELLCLHALCQIAVTASKFAADLLLFSSEHYGFVSLPDEFLTGSSMMPHKRNYDLLELVRANASVLNGYYTAVAGLITGLASGYHRDFQLTKKPLLDGFKRVAACVEVLILVVENLQVHPDAIASALDSDTQATQAALELVKSGMPFRQAYFQVREQCHGANCRSQSRKA